MVNRSILKPQLFIINGLSKGLTGLCISCFLINNNCIAQTRPLSHKECISAALEKSIVKTKSTAIRISEIDKENAIIGFLPSISLNNQHSYSIGRVLDPTTYQFVTNRTVYDMSASIGGSLTLFSGLDRLHQVKKAELNIRSAELDAERTKIDLALEVTRLFLKILMDKEAIDICENKIRLLEKQEELIDKKGSSGKCIDGVM